MVSFADEVSFADLIREYPEWYDPSYASWVMIIVGYPFCPYSAKAKEAAQTMHLPDDAWHFEPVAFGEAGQLKQRLHYDGSFPLVFIRTGEQKHDFRHVGGGNEAEALAAHVKALARR